VSKRLLDLLVAVLVLLLVWPILLACAIAVAATSPGGALFRQERVGRGGKPFTILKFRSMRADAPHLGPHFTASGDPRITPVGRFLRRTSLDELPQLLNVLRGDMSLVGPRPNVFRQREEYTQAEWDARNAVRPGITGLAQATLRSAATPEQRTALDLEYARERGEISRLLFDLKIVWLTVVTVLTGRGGN
jgi:lipopolysaccharide/colanic/teichoic acid biosynthesis glycosyltransferase